MNKEIYLAGGCFWGVEHLYSKVEGVLDAISGYANGDTKDPTYEQVKLEKTTFKETVKVIYDDNLINLESLLAMYFYIIDPTVKNRQGNDIGTQYQTGIYYDNDNKDIVLKEVDKYKNQYKEFNVEVLPLINFYKAEEYHQKYLDKNPNGYCHIDFKTINEAIKIRIK